MRNKKAPGGKNTHRGVKEALEVHVIYAEPGEARLEEAYRLLARFFREQRKTELPKAEGENR